MLSAWDVNAEEESKREEGGQWKLPPAGFILSFCVPLVTADRNFKNAVGCPSLE